MSNDGETKEYKPASGQLKNGGTLIVEDLDCTMKVTTYQGPYRYGFFGRLWKNLTCKHEMTSWFGLYSWCKKCGLMKDT
jgi:hypothetical protein